MKIVYTGLESSGKSLKLAMDAVWVLKRNIRWKKLTGIARPICSNMKFSEHFLQHATEEGIPIREWSDLEELCETNNADIFIDEIGTYFDARLWPELSQDVRRWVAQGAKSGIEIYGAAQDFAQVDISYRRLVNELYLIQKIFGSRRPAATKPPVKHIWGVCIVHAMNPRRYQELNPEFIKQGIIPKFFFIRREYCEVFDTGQLIRRSAPMPFKHVERICQDPNCNFSRVSHT